MNNYTYEQIKKRIFEWEQKDILKYLKKQDKIAISKNDTDALIIDLTFDNCLAQITVSNPIFAPYQFVSLEAMTFDSEKVQESGTPEMIYFFYDTDEMLEEEIIIELEIGIQYCSDYVPNLLRETYLHKRGTLILENKKLYQIVHPSDIKRVKKEALDDYFKCIDIEAQYLVIQNDILSIRVLPQIFRIT